jgi:hypothetical protein
MKTKRQNARRLGQRLCVSIILFVSGVLVTAEGASARPHQQSAPADFGHFSDEQKTSILRIRALSVDGEEYYATGFLVTDDGMVLTAGSVVVSAKECFVIYLGVTYPAEVVFKGTEDGLAVLQTRLQGKRFSIASHVPHVNDKISVIGWVVGHDLTSDSGSIVRIVENKIYYSRESGSRPGFTGGPLINSEGDVIGIHIGATFGSNLAWALNLRSQLPILRKFGILSDESRTVNKVFSVSVRCDSVDERSQTIQFQLEPGQRITDAYASVGDQFQIASVKVSVEAVSGQVVKIRSLVRGLDRRKSMGPPSGACPTGRASILVHARIDKNN